MAQFYTLDEAAQRLNISPDEFKRRSKLEWTSIRPFRDGATLRFRAADIDELARSLGEASDPGLQPGPPGSPGADSSAEMSVSAMEQTRDYNLDDDAPLNLGDEDDSDDDIFVLSGDDDDAEKPDSSVRLGDLPEPSKNLTQPTEEISDMNIDLSDYDSPAVSDAGKSRSAAKPVESDNSDSSSEFELSLDADSDSFELNMEDSDEEDALSDVGHTSQDREKQSGINLGHPADSGVSLEQNGSKPDIDETDFDNEDDIDFELTLDSPSSSDSSLTGDHLESSDDSESEFELSLDDNSGITDALSEEVAEAQESDIFETDFDLPAVEDDSSASLVLEESSSNDLEEADFEVDASDLLVDDDESASEVVMLDDDDEPVEIDDEAMVVEDDEAIAVELDDSDSVSRAMRGVGRRGAEEPVVRTVTAPAPTWGALPAIVLLPTFLIVFLGMLMSYELVRGMWSYQQPGGSPGGMLVGSVADAAGMETTSNK